MYDAAVKTAHNILAAAKLTQYQLKNWQLRFKDAKVGRHFPNIAQQNMQFPASIKQQTCSDCLSGQSLGFQIRMAFQPIVDWHSKSIFGYEALVRGPAGEGAGWVFAHINDDNKYYFDQACRVKAIETAAKLGCTTFLSINFLSNAVYNPETCIKATIEAADLYGFDLTKLIFEGTEVEQIPDKDHLNRIFKSYAKSVFKNISYSYPQNAETLKYLKKLNVKNIKLLGNLKFIENPYDKNINFKKQLGLIFSKYKIWVAASTHHDEEIVCAKAHIILKRKIKNLITIIIPRHINRTNEIISKIINLDLNVIRHSAKVKNLDKSDIYLVDSYGESRKFYEIAKTVFLGGSLTSRGGQNPLEAARYGAKILHGKNIKNFEDIYKYLKKLNFTKSINSSEDLAKSIDFKLLKKKDFIIQKLGNEIFKKTTIELNTLIENAN